VPNYRQARWQCLIRGTASSRLVGPIAVGTRQRPGSISHFATLRAPDSVAAIRHQRNRRRGLGRMRDWPDIACVSCSINGMHTTEVTDIDIRNNVNGYIAKTSQRFGTIDLLGTVRREIGKHDGISARIDWPVDQSRVYFSLRVCMDGNIAAIHRTVDQFGAL
jgi:hypothetical protein